MQFRCQIPTPAARGGNPEIFCIQPCGRAKKSFLFNTHNLDGRKEAEIMDSRGKLRNGVLSIVNHL